MKSGKKHWLIILFVLTSLVVWEGKVYSARGTLLEEFSKKEKIQHIKQYLALGMDFFSSGSYEQAMAFFFSVIKYREFSYLPEYREAMYYLGESYFHAGMFTQAYVTFRKMLALYGTNFPFYPDVIQRLLEISIYRKNFKEAITYFNILKKLLPPEAFEDKALYLLGVSYFNMGKYKRALPFFKNIKEGGEYYIQARYYLASIYLLLNQPVKSYRIFKSLLSYVDDKLKTANRDNVGEIEQLKDFKDLLNLALGRLFFEAGDYKRARSYYLKVTGESRYYDQALYERAWIWAMKRKFGETYRILYKLAEEVPDSPLIPKAQLLYGYCYIEENRYREAEREFKKYLKKYGSIEETLKKIVQSHKDPATFYREIMIKSQTTIANLPIPEDIILRLKRSERLKKSEYLVQEIDRVKKSLEDLTKKLEEVKLLVEKAGKQTIIPGTIFSHNRIKRILYVMRTIELKLLQYKQAEIINAVSLEGAKVLGEVYELRNITSYLSDVLQDLEKKIADKKNELLSILSFITQVLPPDVITKYQSGVTEGITTDERRYLKAKEEIERELKELNALVPVVQNYENKVAVYRKLTFVIEKKIMDHFARKVSYQRKKYLKKIDALLKKIEFLREQIRILRQEMVRKKLQAVAKVKKEILQKEKLLANYVRSLENLQKEAEKVRGDVLVAELERFRKEMDFYTMQAHMGFIDISWKIKEENEARVNALYAAKADEISQAENYYSNLIGLARKKPRVKLRINRITSLKPVSIDDLDKLEEGLDLKDSLYGFNFREVGEDIAKAEAKVKLYSSVVTNLKENPFNPLKPVKIKKKKGKNVYLRLRIKNKLGWRYRIVKVEAFIDGFLLFQNDNVQSLKDPDNFVGFAGMILPGAHQIELRFYYEGKKFLFFKPPREKFVVHKMYYFDCAPHDQVAITFVVGGGVEKPVVRVKVHKKRGKVAEEKKTKADKKEAETK